MRKQIHILCFAAVVLMGGCAHYPVNAPLKHFDAQAGYRFNNLSSPENSDELLVVLAFSGGGTRAAALSYGVLEQLAKTQIPVAGHSRRLLDEVDLISSVSGGSFTAAYYALFGDRIFTEFEPRFLKRNIQDRLFCALLQPHNWLRVASSHFGASDLAAEYYDRHLFEGRTFGDLMAQGRKPFLMINATDIALGARFEFTQNQFDLIGSDLESFPVSRAVAASSAIPILLGPIILKNHAGQIPFAEPAWIGASLNDRHASARRVNRAVEARSYLDRKKREFVHLLDGGTADNLGLRGPLESVMEQGSAWAAMHHFKSEPVRKVILIVVDSHADRDHGWDHRSSNPRLLRLIRSAAEIPVSRYSFETIELFKESVNRWAKEIERERAKVGNASQQPLEFKFYPIELRFNNLTDEKDQSFFNQVPTSLKLPSTTVDRLRRIATNTLSENQVFRNLLRDLQGL